MTDKIAAFVDGTNLFRKDMLLYKRKLDLIHVLTVIFPCLRSLTDGSRVGRDFQWLGPVQSTEWVGRGLSALSLKPPLSDGRHNNYCTNVPRSVSYTHLTLPTNREV